MELDGYIERLGLQAAIPPPVRPHIFLRHFPQGAYLARMGEEVNSLLIMAQGHCRVTSSSEDGKQVVVSYLFPPHVSGDIELLSNCPSVHNVIAAGPVAAIALPRQIFFADMMNHLPFTQMLCKSLAVKLTYTSSKHSGDLLYPLKNRLARYLLSRISTGAPAVFFNTAEAAQYLGITPRHLRRVLAELEAEGVLRRDHHQIVVCDGVRLKEHAADEQEKGPAAWP